jgi:hypothetical protein
MRNFSDLLQNGKNLEELHTLAEKLFPRRVRIGTKSYICECCGQTHHDHILTIKDKPSYEKA